MSCSIPGTSGHKAPCNEMTIVSLLKSLEFKLEADSEYSEVLTEMLNYQKPHGASGVRKLRSHWEDVDVRGQLVSRG